METPFQAVYQLCAELDLGPSDSPQKLPGYPRQSLNLKDRSRLLDFLEGEYCSADLDRIAGRLWWMSKQDSANISPLHRQIVKRRTIVVTEDPKLHLVWIRDRIFVKPLPRYLTSHIFWRGYLLVGDDTNTSTRRRNDHVRKAALGYLRTYFYLIRSESDFRIAQDPSLHLIPPGITWEEFSNFSADLGQISDRDVSRRYAYGEIRLTRLNFYAPFLLGKSNFQRVDYQYREYFAHFYGPILFVVGVISVILSGLQVIVNIQDPNSGKGVRVLSNVSFWFSIVIILCTFGVIVVFVSIFIYKVAKEWNYAIQDRLRNLEEGRLQASES